jgi:flagellar basal-body rod protein FlgF
MLAEQVRQDLISHDLANASTPGYKSDRVTTRSFGDMLLEDAGSRQTIGPLGLGARIDTQTTDITAAPLRDTGEPLDFAVEGDGFFTVRSATGTRYTRDGQFQISSRGMLVTAAGDQVLGPRGQPISVGADGTVAAAELGLTRLTTAKREGDNLFTGAARGAAAGTVRAGALEDSAVNPITTMVDMLGSLRAYEAGQRVITTIDSTLSKATNQVGTV